MRRTRSAGAPSLRRFVLLVFFVGLVAAITLLMIMLFRDTKGPEVVITPAKFEVSKKTRFSLRASDPKSGIDKVVVEAIGGPQRKVLAQIELPRPMDTFQKEFTLSGVDFSDGPFELRAKVTDGSWAKFGKGNATYISQQHDLDTTVPVASIVTRRPYARQGGSVVIGFTVSEEPVRVGVEVGDLFFPAHLQPDGRYLCFFAFPFNLEPDDYQPVLTARDRADNEVRLSVPINPMPREFRTDVLTVSDGFLSGVLPQFQAQLDPGRSPVERFLTVNRELRAKARRRLAEISRQTTDTMLWNGAFVRMRGKTMAQFADYRSYQYNGRKIDEQIHMGVDIASIKNAEVPAANSGRVVFAGFISIYGNVIIIDHGAGLHSLYGHLSRMDVSAGQAVEKGQTIGLTGATGLAGGDHLHFGLTIAGFPVTPIEWWDGHWIEDNVTGRLQ